MKKVCLDHLNTIESNEWHHKGYTAWLNPSPTGYQVSSAPTRCWFSKYLIARPGEDTSAFEASTLAEAREAIEEDLQELAQQMSSQQGGRQ